MRLILCVLHLVVVAYDRGLDSDLIFHIEWCVTVVKWGGEKKFVYSVEKKVQEIRDCV